MLPAAGVYGGYAGAALPLVPRLLDTWVSLAADGTGIEQLRIQPGDILEVPLCDAAGAIIATGLLVTESTYAADALGMFLEGVSAGASSVEGAALLDHVLPGGVLAPNKGLVHLCRCVRTGCTAAVEPRLVLHVDCLRVRSFDKVVEVWARREIINRVKPPAPLGWPREMGATAGDRGGESLPIEVGDEPPRSGRGTAREQMRTKVETLKSRLIHSRKDVAGALSDAAMAHDLESSRKRRSRSRSRKRRRKRRRSRSSSSSATRTTGEDGDFREAPSRARGSNGSAAAQIMTRPGENYMSTMREVSKHLSARGGALAQTSEMQRFVTYLVAVFHGRHAHDKVSARTSAELRLIAECLDALATGNLVLVADLLASRFKALEASVSDGGWATAKHLDALADPSAGLTTQAERREAVKAQLLDHKLKEAAKKDGPGPRK